MSRLRVVQNLKDSLLVFYRLEPVLGQAKLDPFDLFDYLGNLKNRGTFSDLEALLPCYHDPFEPGWNAASVEIRQSSINNTLGWWDKQLIVQAFDVPSISFFS